jgi:Transglycosylase SLT domain
LLPNRKSRYGLLLPLFLGLLSAGSCVAGETATLRNGFSIHYVRRLNAGQVTRLFLSDSAESFVDVPTDDIVDVEQDKEPTIAPEMAPKARPHALDLDQALSAASQHNNLSPALVRSVVSAESGFNPNARSGKGAQGLMQLMPQTAAQLGVKNALDPVENLEGGTRYLSQLLGRYNNDLPIALAAYNAGPERVEQYHGIPPYPETIAYVNRIMRDLYQPQSARSATNTATKKTKKTDHPRTAQLTKQTKQNSQFSAVVNPVDEPQQGN